MRPFWITLLGMIFLAACSSATLTPLPSDEPLASPPHQGVINSTEQPITPPDSPPLYAPRTGDEQLQRAEVYLDSVDLLAMESYPPQFSLLLKGNLPTPCHQLRVLYHEPDAQNRIMVEVYSLADPQAVCVQMLQPFEQAVPLGSFPSGHYTLWINGKQISEFDD